MSVSDSPSEHQRTPLLAALIGLGMTHAVLGAISFWRQAFIASAERNDIPVHVQITLRAAEGMTEWPTYTLYNQLLYLLAGFEPDTERIALASVVLLTLAMVSRAALTGWMLRDVLPSARVLFVVGMAVTLAMPIFNWWRFPSVYLGQISGTIWHNPTSILALPLALWLFTAHMRARSRLELPSVALVGVAIALNLSAKPNYLLAFGPIVAIDLLWIAVRGRWFVALRAAAVYFSPLILLLGFQYAATFDADAAGSIILWPLAVWRFYSPNVPASLLLSSAFPLVTLFTVLRAGRWNPELSIAWGCFALAVLQLALLAEQGERVYHANFFWGAHITLFVLFVVSAKALFSVEGWRARLPASLALGIHALAGVVFYIRSLSLHVIHAA